MFDPSRAVPVSLFENALSKEGVSGALADVAKSIYEQESGSGRNPVTSNAGAVGHMQVIPATFSRFADKGWNIANPEENIRAGIRYLKHLAPLAGDDPKLIAAGYYGGEGAIPKAKVGVAVRDPINPNAPSTLQYGQQVADRAGKTFDPSRAVPVFDPSRAVPIDVATEPVEKQDYNKELAAITDAKTATAAQARRDSMPALNNLMDFGHGATTATRGAMNLVNKVAPSFPTVGQSDMVTPGFSWPKLAGNIVDPAAALVGGAAMKVLPYAQVLGNDAASGARAIAQNVAGGAVPGAALGTLQAASDGGNLRAGATVGAGVGAAANVILPPVLQGLGTLAGKAVDVLKGRYGDAVAARILQQAAGDDIVAIRALAQNADPSLTAAQATAGANNTRIAALGEFAAKANPDTFNRIAQKQAQDRIDALATRIAGGDTQTAAVASQAAKKDALNAITTPMREKALASANAGAPGLRPLNSDDVTIALEKISTSPGTRMNDLQTSVLRNVAEKLKEAQKIGGGFPDANDIYEIRKSAVNLAVEKLLPGDPAAQAKRAAQLLTEVRPLIDKAIVDAGGTGWLKYLHTFEQGMRAIERREMGAVMLDKLKTSPDQFAKLARGDNPEAVRQVFGNEFDIAAAMGPSRTKMTTGIADEITRDAALKANAGKGYQALGQTMNDNFSKFHIPNRLDRYIVYANRILSEVEAKVNAKTAQSLTKAMESGKTLLEAINYIPIQDRAKVIEVINNSPYVKAAALNAITPEQKK